MTEYEKEEFIRSTLKNLEEIIDEGYAEGYELVLNMSGELREVLQGALYAVSMNEDAMTPELDFE